MAERVAEKYATKLLGENDIEAVLPRLDRLTVEESKMTVPEILNVIYGLFNSTQVIMDGACKGWDVRCAWKQAIRCNTDDRSMS